MALLGLSMIYCAFLIHGLPRDDGLRRNAFYPYYA